MPVHDMQVNNPHSPNRRRSTPNVKMKVRRESEREPLETHRELAIKLILLLIGEQPRRRSSHERNRARERERDKITCPILSHSRSHFCGIVATTTTITTTWTW